MANYRYCVYCHTNKINGMKYIGRTHSNPLHRWGLNGSGYDEDNAFGKAIKEYGWDNFTHEILQYGIKGKDNADQIEINYIKEFNTVYPNGYNTENGGVHGSVSPKPYKEKREKTGWKHSEETKQKISESLKKSKTNPLNARIKRSKPVDMYSIDNKYIKTFYGASEASRETGVDISTISKMCKDTKGRYKSAGGYIWRYHGEQKGA